MGGGVPAAAQEESGALRIQAARATTPAAEFQRLAALVEELERTGELVPVTRRADSVLSGRVHETLRQYYRGVPVRGGGVTRQRAGGVTVSAFGTIHQGIELDAAPGLSPAQALDRIVRQAGAAPATPELPELVVLHTLRGTHVLAYQATMQDLRTWFLDAHRGTVVHRERELREQQPAVGFGVGILDDRKKLSVSRDRDDFVAHDRLRPAEIVTLDLRQSSERALTLLAEPTAQWEPADVARDDNNDWRDPAVVDVHAHTGATYDFFALRHGWNGLDGENGRILTMVNIASFVGANAFFAPPPFGPEQTGVVAFGNMFDGTPLVSVDVVAHELMHAVTHHAIHRRTGSEPLPALDFILGPRSFVDGDRTLGCGERYPVPAALADPEFAETFEFACADGRLILFADLGGALNEAYSDIFATAVEFTASGPGQGDYLVGEDLGTIIRSLEDPGSLALLPEELGEALAFPDTDSGIVRFLLAVLGEDEVIPWHYISVDGQTILPVPFVGYTGVHWNSTVVSHAYYLAVEGGRAPDQGAVGGRSRGGEPGGGRAGLLSRAHRPAARIGEFRHRRGRAPAGGGGPVRRRERAPPGRGRGADGGRAVRFAR